LRVSLGQSIVGGGGRPALYVPAGGGMLLLACGNRLFPSENAATDARAIEAVFGIKSTGTGSTGTAEKPGIPGFLHHGNCYLHSDVVLLPKRQSLSGARRPA